jgi:hypothetical protein
MAVLFSLAKPLYPGDRTQYVEDVAAELDGRAEIDVGLIHGPFNSEVQRADFWR